MSSIYWPDARSATTKDRSLRRKLYSVAFFLVIWSVSLLVLLFGLPFIVYGLIKERIHSGR